MLAQRWPAVDDDYQIPMKIKSGNRTLFSVPLPMRRDELHTLTQDQAEELATNSELYHIHFDSEKKIIHRRLYVAPGYKAELVFELKGKKSKKTSKKSKSSIVR